MPLEASVVKSIIKYLNSLPAARAIKVPGDAKRSGEPDIDACVDGRAVKLEVKRPGNNKVTRLQQTTLDKWKAAGAVAGVVHSVDEVLELLWEEGVI